MNSDVLPQRNRKRDLFLETINTDSPPLYLKRNPLLFRHSFLHFDVISLSLSPFELDRIDFRDIIHAFLSKFSILNPITTQIRGDLFVEGRRNEVNAIEIGGFSSSLDFHVFLRHFVSNLFFFSSVSIWICYSCNRREI